MKTRAGVWLQNQFARAGGSDPQRKALVVAREADILRPASDVSAPEAPEPPGLWEEAVPSVLLSEAEAAHLYTAGAGAALPDWALTPGEGYAYPVHLGRVRDVHYAPGFGAVIDGEGRVLETTVKEALYLTPDLGALPSVEVHGGRAWFTPPADAPRLDRAGVFFPWGALSNYGHFLLDALPGLVLLSERGLLERFAAVAPPLTAWQRDLLALALRSGEAVQELTAPIVHVDDLVFTSCMDHFLHAPNAPLGVVRERILAAAPGRGDPPRRLYLSRRGQGKRPLLNEAELEAALQARGFTVIAPEELTVADQLELFRSAEAVVSPTGAALANVLFAPRAAKVFEIQPSVFGGTWVRALSQHVGARWHGYFCPARRQQASGPGAASSFSWTLPTEDFLAHLDAHL